MSLVMKYFVLKPRAKKKNDAHAYAAQAAMYAYATAIELQDYDLAADLRTWANKESKRPFTPEGAI